MTTLTIPDLDERIKQKLLARAARHGRSVEEEARAILAREVEEDGFGTSVSDVIGLWKGRSTTESLIHELRGED